MSANQKPNLILIIVLTAIITAILVGGGIIVYLQSSKTELTPTVSPTTISPKPSPTTSPTAVSQPQETPSQVVQEFMKYSLGTIPDAQLNISAARALLTDDLQEEYTDTDDSSFAADFYGIQDGPTSVKIVSENINGDSASVKVNADWEEMGLGWAFILTKSDNGWLISDFRNDAQ